MIWDWFRTAVKWKTAGQGGGGGARFVTWVSGLVWSISHKSDLFLFCLIKADTWQNLEHGNNPMVSIDGKSCDFSLPKVTESGSAGEDPIFFLFFIFGFLFLSYFFGV